MSRDHNQYYKKDFRTLMMSIALLQLIGLILLVSALVVVFFNWKFAILIGVVGALMFWKFGDLNITMGYKLISFSGSKRVVADILYCEVERPETAGKFRFVAENVGGLFREGDELVLGTLNGEFRCNSSEFIYEVVNKNSFVNYIVATINQERFALFPWHEAKPENQPTSSEKVTWAVGKINEMISVRCHAKRSYIKPSSDRF